MSGYCSICGETGGCDCHQQPPKAEKLKTVIFHQADYGDLGQIIIALPENNGGDEQFDRDFEESMAFASSVIRRRKAASVDRSPKGEDPEGLHAEHESAVTAKPADARKDPS